MRNFVYVLLSLAMLMSCAKDEIMLFEGQDAMSIYVGQYEADSTVYSFAYSLPDLTKDTVFIKIRVQGAAKAVDRKVEMTAVAGSTAVEGQDYILPEFIFPADSVEALYPVVLLRSEALKSETKTLLVAIKANSDFESGALGQERGNSYSIASYKIRFNDYLVKPTYWNELELYYGIGAFSAVKLQFMLTVYGSNNDFGTLSTGEKLNMRLRLKAALTEYELENGPLMDENNQRITF